MSKNVENKTASRSILNKNDDLSNSTSVTEKSSSESTHSLKCPFVPYSRSSAKLRIDSLSSSSGSSVRSKDHHYITLVQPRSASCSFKPIESDEAVEPEENLEYTEKLGKEMGVKTASRKTDEEMVGRCYSTSANEIPIAILPIEKPLEVTTAQRQQRSCNLKDANKVKMLSGPRMTTSDSFISINRKYLQDNERKLPPTEADVKSWENPSSSSKPTLVLVQNKSNGESEQTSTITPVSIFENDKYKTCTDSNSHEDEVLDSMKFARKKSMSGKADFKKGIELKNSSLLSIPSTVCRICHTNTVNERLLSPCYCKGSLAYVHLSCLERWLNQSSRSYCELCLYQYNAVETLRYGFLEGIRLWVRHPRNRNHVRSDCLIAFLLTLVTLGLVVICFIGMDYFMIEGIKLGLSRMWTKSFIVSFLGVIMMGYVVTMYLIVKDQFVPWYTWWKNTLNIRLLLSPTVMQTQRI